MTGEVSLQQIVSKVNRYFRIVSKVSRLVKHIPFQQKNKFISHSKQYHDMICLDIEIKVKQVHGDGCYIFFVAEFSFFHSFPIFFNIENIVIRNGKIVWKAVWFEYYLQLNLVPEDTST